MSTDVGVIEIQNGVGVLTDAENVDVGVNSIGNVVPVQREIVVIGGLGDVQGLNGRPIKLNLVRIDDAYQLPTHDSNAEDLLEAILLESQRQTAILMMLLAETRPGSHVSAEDIDRSLSERNV